MPDFLLEVGLEEIPARMIAAAQAELARRVEELLTHERLLSGGAVSSYSTPRRLAVLVRGVLASQADAEEQLTGPSWAVAFKGGEPTPAAHAFAKKAGVDVGALKKTTTAKGEYVSATVLRKGRSAADVLTEQLPKELSALYWPKNMYWRAGKPERFVRPVKWLLAILDHAIVSIEFAGVHAGNLSYGHRILHGDHAVTINKPSEYVPVLESAKVLVDVETRRQRIRKALDAATRTVAGARWREDEALVDTVTHLTEWPSVLLGNFEAEYLSLPEEVLVTVMRDHQKYFAVEDAAGKLAPHFLAVLNMEADEQGIAVIQHGNERVLRSRFSDARFFWDFDQKIPLTERDEMLLAVTFHRKLGSYDQKVERTVKIAEDLIHLPSDPSQDVPLIKDVDEYAVRRAAFLSKTDLTCELVKEFTELQGIIGGLYATCQGESDTVARAIYDQYKPQSANDPIPRNVEGCVLALSDKLDTLGAMLAIGEKPSGSRDPFSLRRQANGVIKILADNPSVSRHLSFLSERAVAHLDDIIQYWEGGEYKEIIINRSQTIEELTAFFRERVEFYLRDVRGFSYDVVNAVLAVAFDDVRDAIARAEALTAVRGSEDFAAISAAFKRMKNILRQASEKGLSADGAVSDALLADAAEHGLYEQSGKLALVVEDLRSERKYREALEQIATLRPHVDLFFDKVMVMVDDPGVRQNRLALIALVLSGFSSIADFSEIVTG